METGTKSHTYTRRKLYATKYFLNKAFGITGFKEMSFRSSISMITANVVRSLYPMYMLHHACRYVHHLEAYSLVSFAHVSTYVSTVPVKVENFHHPPNFLMSLCSKALSPRPRLPLICFLSLSVSLASVDIYINGTRQDILASFTSIIYV